MNASSGMTWMIQNRYESLRMVKDSGSCSCSCCRSCSCRFSRCKKNNSDQQEIRIIWIFLGILTKWQTYLDSTGLIYIYIPPAIKRGKWKSPTIMEVPMGNRRTKWHLSLSCFMTVEHPQFGTGTFDAHREVSENRIPSGKRIYIYIYIHVYIYSYRNRHL